MKDTLPHNILLCISRLSDEALNVSITSEGFHLEPQSWGMLLGDIFKNLVKGYRLNGDGNEEELTQTIMSGFVLELQSAEPDDQSPIIMPLDAGENN